MTRTEELIRLAQRGDKTASEALITENSALVWSIVRRFMGRGVEADDLYQLGCLGFIKAVDGAVKVSRTMKEQSASLKAVRNQLTAALGREPTIGEISRQTGLTPEEIALVENATAATESINRQLSEDGFSLENILTDTETEEKMVERISLRQAIARLPEREAMVIKLRYYHGLTQERTSKVLQVSQVQVSRIEKKALQSLKELMQS